MGFLETYHRLEDGWYALLDSIDQKIPVYSVVDPIERVVPTFAILMGVIALLAAGVLYALVSGTTGGGYTLTVYVTDEQGNPAGGTLVLASWEGGKTQSVATSVGRAVLRNLPANERITLQFENASFSPAQQTYTLTTREETLSVVLQLREAIPSALTFYFVDKKGASLEGKEINVQLTCSKGATWEIPSQRTENGILTLNPPTSCGTITGSITGEGVEPVQGVVFGANNPVIALDETQHEKSSLKVVVKRNDDQQAISSVDVELFSVEGLSVARQTTNGLGVVVFENVPQGTYYVSVSDAHGTYALSVSENITLQTTAGETIDVLMKRATQGTIHVKVVDATTAENISNATLKLVRKSDHSLVQTFLTKNGEPISALSVDEKGPFILYATHLAYLSQEKDLTSVGSGETITFNLEKLTEQNAGRLVVLVKDEDGLNVDNAQVVIYDAASKFIAQQYAPRATNANGEATFNGLQNGTYFVRVFKYPAGPSDSSHFTIVKTEVTTVQTTLKIGTAALRVSVKDEQNQPVPFARVQFFTQGGNECDAGACAVDADAQGIASYTFKADRKIYARITSEGFLPYTTIAYGLKPGVPVSANVTLARNISGNVPQLTLSRVLDTSTGLVANTLEKGKTYEWVFRVNVPTETSVWEQAGVHIRVGDAENVANQNTTIVSVNAPQTSTMKGSTYSPTHEWFADSQNVLSGNEEAKWANVIWNNMQPGTYEMGARIHVNSVALPLEEVSLYYRAWGKNGNVWERDPFDAELGESENGSGKESLYADTYTRKYAIGKNLSCGDAVCYANESIENLDTQLVSKKEPYSMTALNDYRYSFVLTGGDTATVANAKIRVISLGENSNTTGPTITAYTFEKIPGMVVREVGLSTHTISGGNGQGVDVGTLSNGQTVVGTIDVVGSADNTSQLVIQVLSNGDILFERTLSFVRGGNQNLTIDAQPESVSGFVATSVLIHVKDDQGFDAGAARVRVTKIDSAQNQTLLTEEYADAFGKLSVNLPPSLPGTRFQIDASRGNESANPLLVHVTTDVVGFTPSELAFTLDAVSNADAFLPLDVFNLAAQGMTIQQTHLAGDFQGLLGLDDMQNWLNQYHGNVSIQPGTTRNIQVKASTPESLLLLSGKNLSGKIVFLLEDDARTTTWVQELPFTVALVIPTQCDEEGIQLAGFSTSGSTQLTAFENRVEKPFQLVNSCRVNGNPVNLHDLKAKITWRSQVNGNVEMTIQNPETGAQATEALHAGTFIPFVELFSSAQQTPYEGVLTFTPLPHHVGETADFTITLSASAGAGSEEETILQSFDVKITITNYESCVQFDVDNDAGLVLESDSAETQFSIDTSACGDVPVDVSFCTGAGNGNCSGGAPLGKIYLSQYFINDLKGNKTIRVERKTSTLPGTYDITVDATTPGNSPRRIAALPLHVKAKNNYAFSVEKTAFSIFGKDSIDSSDVENRLVVETVKVRAGKCDWKDSAERYDSQAFREWSNINDAGDYFEGVVGIWKAIFSPEELWDFLSDIWDWAFGSDPCDDHETHPLDDFIIKLAGTSISTNTIPPDAIDVVLSENIRPYYLAEWNIDNPMLEKDGDAWTEAVGLTLTNTSGHTNGVPEFGVMTLRATEHIHQDEFHEGNAFADCSNDNFSPFRVGASSEQGSCAYTYDKTREEKYHIKVSTSDTRDAMIPVTFDGIACESPDGGTGVTGESALPRVSFTWSWNDAAGIAWNACDASNPNAIYCDATQFNIMMQKRLKMLDDFLAANQYSFDCPTELGGQPESGVFTRPTPLPSGFIGYHSFGYSFQGPTTLSFSSVIENTTLNNQDATMTVYLTPISGNGGSTLSCNAATTVPANGSISAQCALSTITEGTYRLVFELSSSTTPNIASVSRVTIVDTSDYHQTFGQTCEGLPKTTALVGNKPGINRWIDKDDPLFGNTINDNPIFTADVPNVNVLRQLTHFDAYLMSDGYTIDFENDFRDYYSTSQFADAPAWFKGNGNGVAGMNAYYGDDTALRFTQKYVDSPSLSASGKYRVDLDMTFDEEWNMIDASGSPAATLKVVFQHVSNPSPSSPFYYLPFNGRVGENSGVFERVGYGLEYANAENVLVLGENAPLYPGTGSSAVRKVIVQPAATLQQLNSLPSSRGNIVSVRAQENSPDYAMQFTPSLATPLVMKITHAESEVPFSVFYQIDRGNTPVNTGNTFTYWEGAGNCYDYTGVPVWEKFNYSPDRKGTSEDALPNYSSVYALDWPRATRGGEEYLRTILYTPANESVNVRANGNNVKFFTANYAAPSTSQLVDGVASMSGNNISAPVRSIRDVFELVKNQHVCVSATGTQTRFFWNPAAVYAGVGQVNVSAFTNGLVAGQTCVGASN